MNIRDHMDHSHIKISKTFAYQNRFISLGSFFTAVCHELHLFPYKLNAVHELLQTDFNKRAMYCNWFRQHCDANLLEETYFFDESLEQLSGFINSQNNTQWNANNPHIFTESSLHPVKIGIWVAISPRSISVHFF